MENNFFDQVGKRTPFRTPEGYFEASEQKLRSITNQQSPIINQQSSIINHQSSIINHQSSIINKYWYYGIAASIVLAIGIFAVVRFVPQQIPAPVPPAADASYCSQTYDNSADWSDFADADIFLDIFQNNLNE